MKQRINGLGLILGMLLLVGACDSPPRGDTGGRVDPYRTTDAEAADGRPLPAAMLEYSDQVARNLAQDIAADRDITAAGDRVTVLVGDILNKTHSTSSNEFEMIRSRLRNQLLNSDVVRDRVKFVERRARMTRIAERERVADGDFVADPPNYDPKTTFALNGDFYRIKRGNTALYYFEFQLVNFATNEIVFSDRYDLKQVR